ncbi:hypothetical protein [Nostoc sp. 'Lobaria pulmonaria (5183) cyanobiont']|uniref:hypothetical protein n=1 Tax=Nostoc sp. 'Lobaria pulmonaria (5183) cyanobiont' TaxID=1618022 RepID=UPI000CF35F8A|nr:hypothetical protein [Nostoc sp. 'Lobaria pulmonaria (5183) cyanobiont']
MNVNWKSLNLLIESKSSKRSNGASDDGVDNLLRQLNWSNAAKTSTHLSTQQSSIRDLLAYDK